jgi:3-mercaptopyruvate sulfurtransferase SseA
MTVIRRPCLITPSQLKALRPSTYIPIDASWHSTLRPPRLRPPASLQRTAAETFSAFVLVIMYLVPGSPSSGAENYSKERIPRARFFDLDLVSSPHPLGLKHMLPTAETFAHHVC